MKKLYDVHEKKNVICVPVNMKKKVKIVILFLPLNKKRKTIFFYITIVLLLLNNIQNVLFYYKFNLLHSTLKLYLYLPYTYSIY
jgi:hypothetical protein